MVIAKQKESNLLKYNVAGDGLAIKLEGDLKSCRTKYFEQVQFWSVKLNFSLIPSPVVQC